ncbi:MAG: SDR family oxidoreductase [Pseudomonadota bacterium]
MAKKTALVSGASAGIGLEIARYHAKLGGDLVVVARREDKLQELKKELEAERGITVHVVTADLQADDGPQQVYDKVKAEGIEIDYLINNAGFGGNGHFHEVDLVKNLGMVDLNIKSLMTMTNLFLKDMVERGSGRILNVGSTAGMVPGPLHATYHGTKAFVNSFSFALAEEVRNKGVTVTLLAPGPVKTEFFDKADMANTNGVRDSKPADEVARMGYEAMQLGDLLVINDWKLSLLLQWVVPFLPRRQVLAMARKFAEKSSSH